MNTWKLKNQQCEHKLWNDTEAASLVPWHSQFARPVVPFFGSEAANLLLLQVLYSCYVGFLDLKTFVTEDVNRALLRIELEKCASAFGTG